MGNNVEVSVIPFHVFSAVIPGNYSLGLFPMQGKAYIIIIMIGYFFSIMELFARRSYDFAF